MESTDRTAVLIVGDSLTSDIKGGINYGIDTCWFNPFHKPRATEIAIQYEIHRLDELLGIVGISP
jgi:2-haloacid dehalogenase